MQAITDLAKLYANDPAVLFNIWNEPTPGTTAVNGAPITEATFMQDVNDRINAVRQYDPNAIVMIFERVLNDIMGTGPGGITIPPFPNFTQGNIMFDSHIYGTGWNPAQTAAKVTYAHSHGEGYIIGEWGGKPGLPDPATMTSFLSQNGVESTYFSTGDLITGNAQNAGSLNSIGQGVAAGYASIFNQPSQITGILTQTPTGDVSPTPWTTRKASPTKRPEPTERKDRDEHNKDSGEGKTTI